jgi:5-methylcytosine-specific restriction protein B
MAYFTEEHFATLKEVSGKKMDRTNSAYVAAYQRLQEAYAITKQWADQVAARLPNGARVRVRQRPTNQANNFAGYNWAKIYPSDESPEVLAYTVGIDADQTFVVKIDTVQLSDQHPTRLAYREISGGYTGSSPIISFLPKAQGLKMSLTELVDWSIDEINGFGFSYDEVAQKLGLERLSDEQVLKHFEGKPEFKAYRQKWNDEEKRLFCRLARFAHEQGFDWWHVGRGVQVRFGRKEADTSRAIAAVATIQGKSRRTLTLRRDLDGLRKFKRQPLTEELVARLEDALSGAAPLDADWSQLKEERPGYWPDEIKPEDENVPDEDQDEGEAEMKNSNPRNWIFYGPPGTGKTYEVLQILKRDYEQRLVSEEPSEWKSRFIFENFGKLNWWEAVAAALYDMGGMGTVTQILEHPFVQAVSTAKGRQQNVRQTLWTTLLMKSARGGDQRVRAGLPIFERTGTAEWKLAGDWEAVCAAVMELVQTLKAGPSGEATVKRHRFVTFHQSYGYEEFVEGLRPVLSDDAGGEIQYEIRSGVFKTLCEEARRSPDHRFAIVIDEINRGNISKIFGELITLIEADKRQGEETGVVLTLPYSGEPFTIPRNVDIIGTMNTADRSLALMDTALRRRFEFFPVMPNTTVGVYAPLNGVIVKAGGVEIDVARMLETMNRRVELLYDRDHCIGHAYFTPLKRVTPGLEFSELAAIFRNRIIPLLEEYFFDDWQKIRLVLGDNQKLISAQFISKIDIGERATELLGADHGMDALLAQLRYEKQSTALDNPHAYLGIYERHSAV